MMVKLNIGNKKRRRENEKKSFFFQHNYLILCKQETLLQQQSDNALNEASELTVSCFTTKLVYPKVEIHSIFELFSITIKSGRTPRQ